MPIVIPKDLPAFDILAKEKIFVMPEARAVSQDIRPIEIAIVNLIQLYSRSSTRASLTA